jgi:hypothetical protein
MTNNPKKHGLQPPEEALAQFGNNRGAKIKTRKQKPQSLEDRTLVVDFRVVFGVEIENSDCPVCSQNVINRDLILISEGGMA